MLKDILKKYVPKELFERPKMGFGIALGQWLKEPLRPWCESLLNEDRLKKQAILNVPKVRHLWKEHLSGSQNHEYMLWNHLVFQHWYRQNFE